MGGGGGTEPLPFSFWNSHLCPYSWGEGVEGEVAAGSGVLDMLLYIISAYASTIVGECMFLTKVRLSFFVSLRRSGGGGRFSVVLVREGVAKGGVGEREDRSIGGEEMCCLRRRSRRTRDSEWKVCLLGLRVYLDIWMA